MCWKRARAICGTPRCEQASPWRDYGFFVDTTTYLCATPATCLSPKLTNPFSSKTQVAYSQNVDLTPFTDPYFRGFDNQFPDYYRYQEWLREFNANYATGGLPALSLVRLMHDHTGNFNDPADSAEHAGTAAIG